MGLKLKKIFALSLISSVFFVQILDANIATAESNGDIVEKIFEETQQIAPYVMTKEEIVKSDNENQSNGQYNRMLDTMNIEAGSVDNYPDYYSGAYLNEDGNLVVKITDDSEKIKNKIKSMTVNNEVIFEKGKYSYKVMNKVKDTILNYYNNNINKYLNNDEDKDDLGVLLASLCLTAIDDQNNCLVVGIEGLSDAKIDTFRKYISDFEGIKFIDSSKGKNLSSNLKAGSGIYISIDEGMANYSMGYRCYKTNAGSTFYGFVTAGHDNEKDDPVYYVSTALPDYYIGYVFARQYSGKVDASFIFMDSFSKYAASNSLFYSGGSLVAGSYKTVANGTTIYKEGYSSADSSSSGLQTGTVTYANTTNYTTESDNGLAIEDVIYSNIPAGGGDSGGIIYTKSSSSNYIVGIVEAEDQFDYTYIIKHANIKAALGITIY